MNKKGDIYYTLILAILMIIIVIVGYVILKNGWGVFTPIVNVAHEICVKTGLCQEGGTCIQSFRVERGLAGDLSLRYVLINNKNMNSYQINQSWLIGHTEVSDIWDSKILTTVIIDEGLRNKISLGEELQPFPLYNLDPPAALNNSKYILTAFDDEGNILDHYEVEHLGVFTKDNDKYMTSITSFMELAQGLKDVTGQKNAEVRLHPDLVMVGFSKDFNLGNGLMRHMNPFCSQWTIKVPDECKDQSTCLCLCKKAKDKSCGPDGGLCYGYPEYRFLGGTRRACPDWSGSGLTGEENRPINVYKGQEFEDSPGIFNSLAMIKANPDPVNLQLVITQYNKIFPPDDSVNCLIISKRE